LGNKNVFGVLAAWRLFQEPRIFVDFHENYK